MQPNIRKEMHAYLGGACKNLGCPVLAVGGIADHVHILCALSRTFSIADVVREIKQGSSKWIKTKGGVHSKFAWQGGYGAFSVSQSQVQRVRTYIERQEGHHRKKAFEDEYRTFLKMHGINTMNATCGIDVVEPFQGSTNYVVSSKIEAMPRP